MCLHPDSRIVAYHNARALPEPTIRHNECAVILARDGSRVDRCQRCTDYRRTLHAMVSRQSQSQHKSISNATLSSHTNYRYLSTPEKIERLGSLHHENRSAQKKLQRLRVKVAEMIASRGISLDAETTGDSQQIMEEEEHHVLRKFPPDSFQSVFWQQQKEATSRKDKRGMRWHPAMLKWCLYLRHQSSKAYETLQQSGCLQLPSQRTLRDYTHCVKSEAGFSAAVDLQLMQAIGLASCQECMGEAGCPPS